MAKLAIATALATFTTGEALVVAAHGARGSMQNVKMNVVSLPEIDTPLGVRSRRVGGQGGQTRPGAHH